MIGLLRSPVSTTTGAFVRRLLRRHRGLVLASLACALLAALFEGSTMGIFALALHSLTSSGGESLAATYGLLGKAADLLGEMLGEVPLFPVLAALGVAAQILRSGSKFAGDLAAARFLASVEAGTRRRLFRQSLRLSFAQIQRYRVGDLSSLFEHVNYLGLAAQRINVVIGQLALLVVYMVLLLWLSWQLTLMGLVAMLLLVLLLQILVRRIRRAGKAFKSAVVSINEQVVEFLHALRLVHSFGRQDYAEERVRRSVEEAERRRREALSWQAALTPLIDSLAALAVGLLLVVGYWNLRDGDPAELAQFATYLFVLYRMVPRFGVVNKNWGLFNNYLPFVERIADFLTTEKKSYFEDGEREHAGLQTSIRFRDVSFGYGPASGLAVDGVSFELARGTTTALVGESGAGKTTIADLVLRLYRPTAGRILVDGIDLAEFGWPSWLDRIGVVGQETFLLYDSVYNNIVFGREGVTRAQVEEAAAMANADRFVAQLPDGYATQIGQRGYRLSGGQRQRLAIARAILRSPDLLILDEATSDLDSRSENLIQQSLRSLHGRTTILIIAHRLSTIASADQIVFLESGRLVEQGTHDELLAADGRYARFWKLQTSRAGSTSSPDPLRSPT